MTTTSTPVTPTGPTAPAPEPAVVSPEGVPAKFIKDGKVDVAALAKSYTELESKQGKPADPIAENKPATNESPVTVVPKGFEKYETEFVKDGKLSDASYIELETKTGMTRADVDSFINFRKTQVDSHTASLLESIGGQKVFDEVSTWATENLDKAEIDSINKLIADKGNTNAAKLALQGLRSRMESKVGKAPSLVGGTPGSDSVMPFKSVDEAVKATQDPRYKTDTAYQNDVVNRMKVSGNLFNRK